MIITRNLRPYGLKKLNKSKKEDLKSVFEKKVIM